MILGTNGSGKSSLAQLGFSPLPINPKWMKAGGYFIKEGTYKGDRYYLEGRYIDSKKVTYTFKKNDEVLLDAGNVTTYVDLVKLHLNYDKWLHELLIGKVKFTELGPQQRQDFLSRISNSDFTTAFKLLGAYKKRHTHYISIVQFLQSRINEEAAKLLSDEEMAEFAKQRAELQEEFNTLEEVRLPEIDNSLPLSADAYEDYNDHLERILTSAPVSPCTSSPEELKRMKESAKERLQELTGQLKYVSAETDEITQKLGFIETNADENVALIVELNKLREEMKDFDKLPGNVPVEYYVPNAAEVIDLLMYTFGSYSSEPLDKDREIELHKAVLEADNFLKRCEMRFEQINSQLDNIARIEMVKCPQCDHEFKPGVDPKIIIELNQKRDTGLQYIAKAKQDYSDVRASLDEYLEGKALFTELEDIRNRYKDSHRGIFTYIDSLGGMDKGKKLVSPLATYKAFCQAYHRKLHLSSKIERLASIAQDRSEIEKDLKELKARLEEKTNTLVKLRSMIDNEELIIRSTDKTESDIRKEEMAFDMAMGMAERFLDAIENDLTRGRIELHREAMDNVMGRLATIHKTLNDQDGIKALIDDFEKQLVLAKKKVLIMKEVVEALSPKTGLIAEQLSISIGSWVDDINQLIDKVWGYSLEIRMGQVGDNGLDYRFPMRDSEEEREDVSEGSDSMLEWINRAVVMVAYYSLDLTDMPLFLDEPGRTFDRVHQLNIIPLIRDLSDSVRFSQIVLISHNEEVQTAFPNSETVILDDRNIDYPHPYNLHVNFEEPR